jgi:hypothetical protein
MLKILLETTSTRKQSYKRMKKLNIREHLKEFVKFLLQEEVCRRNKGEATSVVILDARTDLSL